MKTRFNATRLLPAVISGMIMGVMAFSSDAQTPVREYIAPRTTMPQVPPGFTGIGPVVSGSIDYSKIPSKARKFLEKHCDGHAVVKCQKEYSSGGFDIALADGIEMEFDAKGALVGIQLRQTTLLPRCCLKLWFLVNYIICLTITGLSRA